jgi:hypothetical protein
MDERDMMNLHPELVTALIAERERDLGPPRRSRHRTRGRWAIVSKKFEVRC